MTGTRIRVDSTGSRWGHGLLPTLMLAAVSAQPLPALNPNLSFNQYLHFKWTQEEGTPLPPTVSLAQTGNGYLWIGSDRGLMKSDGMRFVDWLPASEVLPDSRVRSMSPASGGGLWIATPKGVFRLDHDKVIRYPSLDKLPCPAVHSMVEDRSGRLWMLNMCPDGNAIAALSPNGKLQIFGKSDGLPDEKPAALFQDRHGSLWVGVADALCRWTPGSQAACWKSPGDNLISITEMTDGDMAIADGVAHRVFRYKGGKAEPIGSPVPGLSFLPNMLCDRDGNIWIGTTGGLLRFRDNKVERFTSKDGLSNDLAMGLLEDREGDLWIGTARGIDRIRDPKVQLFSTSNGLSNDFVTAVSGSWDGAVWAGSTGGGLNRIAPEGIARYSIEAGLPDRNVSTLFEDAQHRLWVGTSAGLAVQSGDRFVEVVTSDGQHLDKVSHMGGNSSGSVLVVNESRGLFAIRGRVAYPVSLPAAETADLFTVLAARNGDIWLGHYGGGVTVLSNGSLKRYGARDGLAGGPVKALLEDREGNIWVGADGLSRFRDARWTTWTTAQNLPDGGVKSIVEDDAGALWLMAPAALFRLSRSDITGPAKPLSYDLYGSTEGLRLTSSNSSSALTLSRDGRLWAATEVGVAAIDPARIRRNLVPPPAMIEQVVADGKPYDPASPGPKVFRGHNFQISYTGISLMVPERVHFKYRLDGLDPDWIDAGTRRNVTYGSLGPGHYRFLVMAANNDNVWNETTAEVALRVDPYLYQTWWFALLCLSSIGLTVWFVHHLRMRSVVSRVRLIAAERVRFGRELHDSLLQGFSGVVYLLEAAARQFDAAPEISKQRLEKALDQADQSLREARQMIVSMRIPALENNTLPEAVRTTTQQMVSDVPVEYHFDVKGRVRQAPYEVEANLFMIAREALTNCLNHAAAHRIRLELKYTQTELHLTIQDDGTGFDPEKALKKDGHYGFRGMRERARLIGATFTVKSGPGCGSTIDVVVPWKKK